MKRIGTATISLVGFLLLATLVSCRPPHTFIRTPEPGWNVVEIRDGLAYDQVWDAVVDLLARRFDIEILSKADGYIRTGWLYTWTGKPSDTYKVRAVIKFSPDRSMVEVKSEAWWHKEGWFGRRSWVLGTDDLLATTLRTDLMGQIGRVTR